MQKKKLIENTEAFISGKEANNVLLFGDAGTGKSSSVKAILNEYYGQGLRMIEVYKHQFKALSEVLEQIKDRNYKFIIYMDDLSFEEYELEYKYLKAILEGGLGKRPKNVLIYATSNRRHLIREKFSDKRELDDDLHNNDTVQEKLSLAARFGVTIYYGSPDKFQFQGIVKALAEKYHLDMPEEELLLEANKWKSPRRTVWTYCFPVYYSSVRQKVRMGLIMGVVMRFLHKIYKTLYSHMRVRQVKFEVEYCIQMYKTDYFQIPVLRNFLKEHYSSLVRRKKVAVRMFAAIDVGSFALELGIYEISDKTGIRNVEHIRHVIALGSDTFSEGKISYDLVDEMCRVLEKFTETMKMYRVKDYRAYATTAMREAKNSRIILDQIRVRTGLEVHIISNSEQRFISYKAVASKGGEFNQIIQKGTAIVDVGFGSAQISLFDKDSLVATQNLPLGSLRLRSQLAKIPASVDGHRLHIEEIVDNELITFRKMYLRDRQITNLIGIGDNILYLMRRLGIKGGEKQGRLSCHACFLR